MAYITIFAPNFDATAWALFTCPGGHAVEGGRDTTLISDKATTVADQATSSQSVLRGLCDDRAAVEELVRD